MSRLVAISFLLLAALSLAVQRSTAAESNERLASPALRSEAATGANTAVVGFIMAQVGAGTGTMIYGLSIPAGAGQRQMLVRAAGPALAALGTIGTLSDPAITIFNSAGARIASNDNWEGEAFANVAAATRSGALPFAPDSKDAAVSVTLAPGNYVIQVSSVGGDTGTALVEVHDVTPARSAANVSVASRLATSGPNQSALSTQLLFHLPLKSGANDASSNQVPVRMQGVTFRDGAAWFDGNNSELAMPHQALDHRPFAVAMWIKIEGDFPTCGLVEQRSADRPNQHLHLMIRGTLPHLGFYVNDLRTRGPITPRDGWTHVVFQYTTRRQEIWVNGKCVGTRRARAYAGTEGEFVIGRTPRWTNVPSTDFKGGMRDVRVYARALSPVEIDALASNRL